MHKLIKLFAASAMAITLMLPGNVFAAQAAAEKGVKTKSANKATASPAASASEIADAKAKGLVWVNTGTKVYHKDGQFYGKTKQGKFMTEADAQKAGFRAAKQGAVSKTKSGEVKK